MGLREPGRPPTDRPATLQKEVASTKWAAACLSPRPTWDRRFESVEGMRTAEEMVFTWACSSVRFVLLFRWISSLYVQFSVGMYRRSFAAARSEKPLTPCAWMWWGRLYILDVARGCRWRARMSCRESSFGLSLPGACCVSSLLPAAILKRRYEFESDEKTLCPVMLCFTELEVFMLSSQWVFSAVGYPNHLFSFVWFVVIWITMVYIVDTTWQLRFMCVGRMRSESLTQSPNFMLWCGFQFWNSTDVTSVLYTPCCLARITYWTSPW